MFICIGENYDKTEAVGTGETVEEAIKNWAYNADWHDIVAEFNCYEPTVIEGKSIDISIKIPEPVPVNTIHD